MRSAVVSSLGTLRIVRAFNWYRVRWAMCTHIHGTLITGTRQFFSKSIQIREGVRKKKNMKNLVLNQTHLFLPFLDPKIEVWFFYYPPRPLFGKRPDLLRFFLSDPFPNDENYPGKVHRRSELWHRGVSGHKCSQHLQALSVLFCIFCTMQTKPSNYISAQVHTGVCRSDITPQEVQLLGHKFHPGFDPGEANRAWNKTSQTGRKVCDVSE